MAIFYCFFSNLQLVMKSVNAVEYKLVNYQANIDKNDTTVKCYVILYDIYIYCIYVIMFYMMKIKNNFLFTGT